MSHNETFTHEPTWRSLGTLKPAPSLGLDGDAAKWLKLWLHWATCASREVCRPDVWNGFYSYSSPSFSWFIIHQTSDWRPYFISPALEKKCLSSPAGGVSYMTTKSLLLRLRCACARARFEVIKTGDNSFVYWAKSKLAAKCIKRAS